MKVTLTTLCGCSKEVETTYPPAPEIILPLQEQLRVTAGINKTEVFIQPMSTRRFKLRDFMNAGPRYSTAKYMEVNGEGR